MTLRGFQQQQMESIILLFYPRFMFLINFFHLTKLANTVENVK